MSKKILYVFPHPDDESFGPAPAMAAQRRNGHDVFLLTLTRGEATRQRFKLGVDKKKMGEIRLQEMKCVEKVLDLSGMTVLDFPDNKLKDLDPIDIEKSIEDHIKHVKPDVLVTYAVHGVSGFHDHLVSHAVVKRVYCELKKTNSRYPSRLALFTRMGEVDTKGKFRLEVSTEEEIDCITECNESDMEKFHKALDCYETYQEIIEKSGVKEVVTSRVPFEFFQEKNNPAVNDIFYGL